MSTITKRLDKLESTSGAGLGRVNIVHLHEGETLPDLDPADYNIVVRYVRTTQKQGE